MIPLSRIEDITNLYAARGHLRYGEGVTQIEHALQCASLMEERGGSPDLVVAALLHDIGHLFENEAEALQRHDRHEASGANALATLFGEAIWKPIALHVAAKRYLCFTDSAYFASLSPASKASLTQQGGIFDAGQAASFKNLPYAREATMLRRVDDAGKRDDLCGRSFNDFLPTILSVAKTGQIR